MQSLVKPPHNFSPGSIWPATSRYTLAVSRNQMDRGHSRGSSFSQILRPFTTSFSGRRTNNRASVLIFGCILPYTYLYTSKGVLSIKSCQDYRKLGILLLISRPVSALGTESIRKTGGPALLLRAFLRPQARFAPRRCFGRRKSLLSAQKRGLYRSTGPE
jgi:hypothetical protein